MDRDIFETKWAAALQRLVLVAYRDSSHCRYEKCPARLDKAPAQWRSY